MVCEPLNQHRAPTSMHLSFQKFLNSSTVLAAPRMRVKSTSTPTSPKPQNALQKSSDRGCKSGVPALTYLDSEVVEGWRRADMVRRQGMVTNSDRRGKRGSACSSCMMFKERQPAVNTAHVMLLLNLDLGFFGTPVIFKSIEGTLSATFRPQPPPESGGLIFGLTLMYR